MGDAEGARDSRASKESAVSPGTDRTAGRTGFPKEGCLLYGQDRNDSRPRGRISEHIVSFYAHNFVRLSPSHRWGPEAGLLAKVTELRDSSTRICTLAWGMGDQGHWGAEGDTKGQVGCGLLVKKPM